MIHVLTLVAASTLEHSIPRAARSALEAAGARAGDGVWLAPAHAYELPFEGIEDRVAEAAARAALGTAPVDLLAQPEAGRRKRLLLADMDSTIVVGETLDELADFAGLKAQISALTARAMRGEIDFEAALKERVAMLAGLDEAALEATYARLALTPGAETLARTMRKHGAFTALISGGFRFFTSRVKARAGFDLDIANSLETAGGKLTGRVVPPIVNRNSKLDALKRLAAERGLALGDTLAVGDGANDLPMIQAAGLGVAYRGKPAVAAAARARVDHGDLTTLLYFQGFTEAEFAR
ncbi:MAG TPA: phosphoserine phosphatase SerB [Alphaproteobacteria bacterium]|nr:phosphoserine phosphatase SerB [Alphaproteobacteria bacterium]